MNISRRTLLQAGAACAGATLPFLTCAQSGQHVVILGGGFGGVTAAKYLRRFNPNLRLTLIEPAKALIMCPMSMRVIHGGLNLNDISRPYAPFVAKYGLRWVNDYADGIDPVARHVVVGREKIRYDRLIVAPGVDFNYDNLPGLQSEEARAKIPHAWKAGPQTIQLREMLRAMPSAGVMAMHVPKGALRARPAAFERASLVAHMLRQHNPKAKLLVFDAGAEPPFAKDVILSAWKSNYGNMIDYVPGADIEQVDAADLSITFKKFGKVKANILNIIPPQRAGSVALQAGLANVDKQWCGVDFLTMESVVHKGIHVLGDAVAGVPGMPKSGQIANQQAKVCAAAIAALTLGQSINQSPAMISAGYTYITPNEALNTSAVFRYNAEKRTMVPVKEAGASSTVPSLENGLYGSSWATNILDDMMA